MRNEECRGRLTFIPHSSFLISHSSLSPRLILSQNVLNIPACIKIPLTRGGKSNIIQFVSIRSLAPGNDMLRRP